MNIDTLFKAVDKAAADSAVIMTHQLRQHALQHGWEPDVTSGLYVKHHEGKFSINIHPSVADRAFVHEYGNETKRPTAALRKYINDTSFADKALLNRLSHHYSKGSK